MELLLLSIRIKKGYYRILLKWFFLVSIVPLVASCAVYKAEDQAFKTENVIVVVIDGPRYSETWGVAPGLIPFMAGTLKEKGVFFSDFQNEKFTYTNSGHAAITTGVNQEIDNFGNELPANPSYFQYWLKATGKPATSAWLVMSKDKLDILANTQDSLWHGQFTPSLNCGIDGPGTGYRADSLTLLEAKKILGQHRPNLMLINFMEPDGYAHAGNWDFYLRGISRSDTYVNQLWEYLQNDEFYKNKTTLLITNDHGRHLNDVENGWVDHGDLCEGCRHISLLAVGPDFKRGATITEKYTLVDIPVTISPLIGVKMDKAHGQVIRSIFSRKALKKLDQNVQLVQ